MVPASVGPIRRKNVIGRRDGAEPARKRQIEEGAVERQVCGAFVGGRKGRQDFKDIARGRSGACHHRDTSTGTGGAGIGLLTSRINLEGPLIKDKTSFIIGARTTYANWLLNILPDQYSGFDGLAKSDLIGEQIALHRVLQHSSHDGDLMRLNVDRG